jgi:glycosyltransferase involved in cell wall biosynthesis
MITISACMIVKNEAALLRRCLSCVKQFADEIIIVDTGSLDNTKAIAAEFTSKVFDYEWKDDFAAARNVSFSYAACDFIYVADADEIIDERNIRKIVDLKNTIDPKTDIVQMLYTNQLEYNTTYNFNSELRPKLFKRIRKLKFMDPIHETAVLEPFILDSDIEIIHKPAGSHSCRDFDAFLKITANGEMLSERLNAMYARELFVSGTDRDFKNAAAYFNSNYEKVHSATLVKQFQCVMAKAALVMGDRDAFFKAVLKNIATGSGSSEICFLLGEYYFKAGDFEEAAMWYYNAYDESQPELNIRYSKEYPLKRLAEAYHMLGNKKEEELYINKLKGLEPV